jgi:hypothetical protein
MNVKAKNEQRDARVGNSRVPRDSEEFHIVLPQLLITPRRPSGKEALRADSDIRTF